MKLAVLFAATLLLADNPPAPTQIDCGELTTATFGETQCDLNEMRIAADHTRGIFTSFAQKRDLDCKANAQRILSEVRQAFITNNYRIIKMLRPNFGMLKASHRDWIDLMYHDPAMCAVKPVTPAPSRNSN